MLSSKIGFLLIAFVCYPASTEDMAKKLLERYNNMELECFDSQGNTYPAYGRHGLLLRGTINIRPEQTLKYSWNFKYGKESLSFAFLRIDMQFIQHYFIYQSGMVVYPPLETPPEMDPVIPICAYPIDAHTDDRTKDKRCTNYMPRLPDENSNGTEMSDWCDKQGITTASAWEEHYNEMIKGKEEYFGSNQCAFDMTNVIIKHSSCKFQISF